MRPAAVDKSMEANIPQVWRLQEAISNHGVKSSEMSTGEKI
jgi:hypothetical protein